jgi:hypothetical protein
MNKKHRLDQDQESPVTSADMNKKPRLDQDQQSPVTSADMSVPPNETNLRMLEQDCARLQETVHSLTEQSTAVCNTTRRMSDSFRVPLEAARSTASDPDQAANSSFKVPSPVTSADWSLPPNEINLLLLERRDCANLQETAHSLTVQLTTVHNTIKRMSDSFRVPLEAARSTASDPDQAANSSLKEDDSNRNK